MSYLPSGTVTFLFTDVESSSIVAQQHPEAWEAVQERQQAILRAAIQGHCGYVFKTVGDGFCAAFDTVRDSLQAALEAQETLQAETWGDMPIRVRMGIHTGEAQARGDDYSGYLTLTRVQRLMSAAHGGQILVSNASAELARQSLPGNLGLRDMGEHRLKSLLSPEHIWQVTSPDLEADFPAIASVSTAPNNLPVQLTSFVGREDEIARLCSLLQMHRLVTLTGTAGTGKTRLALQVADETLDCFRDGVWFIELAPLSDPGLVTNATASVLGVREQPGRALLSTLLDWLEGRELLLVLDNCEHLITPCAEFVDTVLRAGRRAHVLASSREALCIQGETTYHVPSLASPEPAANRRMPVGALTQYAAIQLFVERAREAAATFTLTESNAPAVVQICHHLDGIPLAIELAAVRVKVLSVEQIADRLDDRFGLLTAGSRIGPQHHQTLRSLIDWSYSLLTGPEQILLGRLSAFAGGWTLEAAEQVCAGGGIERGDILDLLMHLADKSLVAVTQDAQQSRYRMLETIRQYAREKLVESGETAAVRNRHLGFMQGLAENAERKIYSRDESVWLERLDREIDNLRAALEWAHSLEDPEPALRLVGSVWFYWSTRDYWHDAQVWIREALDHPGAGKRTKGRARALTALGYFMAMTDDHPAARQLLEESAGIARDLGDKPTLVVALAWLGWTYGFLGDYAAMQGVVEEGLSLARELNDKLAIAMLWLGLGNVNVVRGQHDAAETYYQDGVKLLRETGDRNFLAFALRRLGYLALRQGDVAKALSLFVESLDKNREIADKRGVAACLTSIACIAVRQGDARRAARLYGATAALVESFEGQIVPIDQREQDPYALAAREGIGEEPYAHAYAEGREMSMEQAVAYALERPAG